MKRTSLWFTGQSAVELRSETLPDEPPSGQVLVQTRCSAISPGTEMLFYRGAVPADLPVDASISSLQGAVQYPLKYGYACVGQVAACGAGVSPSWQGQWVFSFHPHESAFFAAPEDLLPVPPGLDALDAAFLPNMETAVNFVMDGQPLLGERVAVLGLGIVGLLTTALLARFPLGQLLAYDRYLLRRSAARQLGDLQTLDPQDAPEDLLDNQGGADLVFELTGSPQALDLAIRLAGFSGRVVIGSWYGQKSAPLHLGGRFHRSRIQLISSQVSTVAPRLTGRWDKARRMQVAWQALHEARPSRWITQRFPIGQAAAAYRLLDERPQDAIQVILEY